MDCEWTWIQGCERRSKDGELVVPHAPNAQVESIGFVYIDTSEPSNMRLGVFGGHTEEPRVAGFLRAYETKRPQLVTFNGRGSDVPVLAAAAMRHRLLAPRFFSDVVQANRYHVQWHMDLFDALTNFGATRHGGMSDWAQAIGWPGKGDVDGSMVAAILEEPNGRERVDAYCLCDAVQHAALFLEFMLASSGLNTERHVVLAEKLLELALVDKRTSKMAEGVDKSAWLRPARKVSE